MLEPRHRPSLIRRYSSGLSDQVPSIVEAYVLSTVKGVEQAINEMEVGRALSNLEKKFYVEHVPSRQHFEKAFISRRASPADVKKDPKTDRLYLIGAGLPGREEFFMHEQGFTDSVVKDDAVLVYTEVSWTEWRDALATVDRLPQVIQQGLELFYKVPNHNLPATVLALPSVSEDQLYGIAAHALNASGS